MPTSVNKIIALVIIVAFSKLAYSSDTVQHIRDFDFNAYLTRHYADCLTVSKSTVDITSIEYHDLNGDGREEALVIASSCHAGTGGPDIHAVYALDQTGRVRELAINDNKGVFMGKPVYNYLTGNRNYTLRHDDDLLVEEFHDNSGREFPLTLSFKWTGNEFKLVDVVKAKTYKTSFDCDKAGSDAEKTVCMNQDIAGYDLELASLYKKRMNELSAAQKVLLRKEQLNWLAGRDSQCTSKWIDECLREKYSGRIKDFKTWK